MSIALIKNLRPAVNTGGAVLLMMSVVADVHAASQANIEFSGKIVKTSCDVVLSDTADSVVALGAFAANDFTNQNIILTQRPAPIRLDLGSCSGANVPGGKTVNLIANQTNASVPNTLKAAGLWGNEDLGVGIALSTATYSGTGSLPADTAYTRFVPGQGFVLFTSPDTPEPKETDASSIALPAAVFIKAGLRSYQTAATIKSGDIKSNITFTASYD